LAVVSSVLPLFVFFAWPSYRHDGQAKNTKRGRTDDTTAKREGQTIRRPNEKDKKRKDRRYDDKARRTKRGSVSSVLPLFVLFAWPSYRLSFLFLSFSFGRRIVCPSSFCSFRLTDDTTAKREGQKEEGQTIRRPNEKDKKRKDRRYDDKARRTDDTTAKRKGQKETDTLKTFVNY
jgi:hypothetical protein